MVAALPVLTLLIVLAAPVDTSSPPPAPAAPPETTAVHPRVVRTFPPIEVSALLPDMRASQTVHLIPGAVLHSFPVHDLADVIALQPGVVAQAEELHVRGGRAGETVVSMDGLSLNEPLRHRAMGVPLLALRGAELVTGAPEARYGGGLAGVLDLRTVDPAPRPSLEWRWTSDGRRGTHYDRVAARAGTPLHALGLGVVAAADATLDDTALPMLRTASRHEVAGGSFGWRAENRMLGFLKVAPVREPERYSAQLLVSRGVHRPYNPSWSLDGWTYVPANLKTSPTFSPEPLPGYQRYRAADHLAITDERQAAALIRVATLHERGRGSLGLGWLRAQSVTSVGGRREPASAAHRPKYGKPVDRDGFHVLWGDYPLYRESDCDVLTLRGDGELRRKDGSSVSSGAGLTYESVSMREMDWMPLTMRSGDIGLPPPLDSLRSYRAYAPGGYAYAQGRWLSGGMILNAGLRTEYFTPGPQATQQTLPGSAAGIWSFAPRLGLAYPISVRDVFSFAYVRMQQAPGRDYLYDQRTAISDRQPLGNPALGPATLISYEAAVKHLAGPRWAMQTSVFYRDVFGQVGTVDQQIAEGPINLRYAGEDQSHVSGWELSVIHSAARRHLEAHYTWMVAAGNESRPEGDPYGPVRAANTPAIGTQPLSWDRRHSFLFAGAWQWSPSASLAWSTALSSPLPWTPKQRRQMLTDLGLINSRRLGWTENTDLDLSWSPRRALGLAFGLEVRNLWNGRAERAATVDGYPNPIINTLYDDYGAYRTETGLGGGAYWSQMPGEEGHWVPVHDARLYAPPRTVRMSVGGRW